VPVSSPQRVVGSADHVQRVGVLPAVEVRREELQLQGVLRGAQVGGDGFHLVRLRRQAGQSYAHDDREQQRHHAEGRREALTDPHVLQPRHRDPPSSLTSVGSQAGGT
jgi:hypothetical protein